MDSLPATGLITAVDVLRRNLVDILSNGGNGVWNQHGYTNVFGCQSFRDNIAWYTFHSFDDASSSRYLNWCVSSAVCSANVCASVCLD